MVVLPCIYGVKQKIHIEAFLHGRSCMSRQEDYCQPQPTPLAPRPFAERDGLYMELSIVF
jgi:hypothetical protein